MARGEDEPQQVVPDLVIQRGIDGLGAVARGDVVRQVHLGGELDVLLLEHLVPPQLVQRPVLRRRHEPGARVVRHARARPGLERGDQRVLRQLLGKAHVAHEAGEAGDELRRLDAPDRLDRAPRVLAHRGLTQPASPPAP